MHFHLSATQIKFFDQMLPRDPNLKTDFVYIRKSLVAFFLCFPPNDLFPPICKNYDEKEGREKVFVSIQ